MSTDGKKTNIPSTQPIPDNSRRDFIRGTVVQAALGLTAATVSTSAEARAAKSANGRKKQAPAAKAPAATPIAAQALPFAEDALAPFISAQTLAFHYGKHYKGYCDTVAKLVAGSPLEAVSLESVVAAAAQDPTLTKLFNNAAQAWNHGFYWKSLSPKAQAPSGALLKAIERDFVSVDALKTALNAAATGQFGSGWAWLVLEEGKLKVTSTSNADTPIIHQQTPLLTIDVWEHAYYLDYQNKRADYVKAVIDKTLNWDFAMELFENA